MKVERSEFEQLLEHTAKTLDRVVSILKVMGVECSNGFRDSPRVYDTNDHGFGSVIDFNHMVVGRNLGAKDQCWPIRDTIDYTVDIKQMVDDPEHYGPMIWVGDEGETYIRFPFQYIATGIVMGVVCVGADKEYTFTDIEELINICRNTSKP